MASAIEKFIKSMNKMSSYWTKSVELTAHEGEIIRIKCDGFTFKSDKKEQKC